MCRTSTGVAAHHHARSVRTIPRVRSWKLSAFLVCKNPSDPGRWGSCFLLTPPSTNPATTVRGGWGFRPRLVSKEEI